MTITFVFDGLQVGGIERIGVEYIKLLTAKGYNIQIINLVPKLSAMEAELPKNINIVEYYLPRNFCAYRYKVLEKKVFLGKILYPIAFAIIKPIENIKKISFRRKNIASDIVIAFSGHINDLTFVSNEFIDSDKKLCWLHGSEYSYFELSSAFCLCYKKIKNLVCLSDKDDDNCKEFNRQNDIKKWKIYNPINCADKKIDFEKVNKLKKLYGNFCLMVGRLAGDKDQSTVIKAVKYLHDKYGFEEKMIFVGDGPTRQSLETLVDSLDLSEQVIFAGTKYDVQNYYSAAFSCVHSSPAEGMPTVILEAMYYGVPIATTNSEPGVKEILGDSDCMLVSDVGDYKQLAENIYQIYSDDLLRERQVSFGKKRIQDFMPDRISNQIDGIIQSL